MSEPSHLPENPPSAVPPAQMDDEPTETRWLTENEQQAWRSFLRGWRQLIEMLDRDMQAEGVQLSEYEILSMLSEVEGQAMRMSTLADIVIQSRSRLTHTASRLEQRGWVRRRPVVGDRRGVELALTEAGSEAVAALAPIHVESVRRRFIDFIPAEEFSRVGRAMATVRAGLLGVSADERVW